MFAFFETNKFLLYVVLDILMFSWIFSVLLIKTNFCVVVVVPKTALRNYNSNASKLSVKLPLASIDENPNLKLVQTLS